jgi:hypothetical protein
MKPVARKADTTGQLASVHRMHTSAREIKYATAVYNCSLQYDSGIDQYITQPQSNTYLQAGLSEACIATPVSHEQQKTKYCTRTDPLLTIRAFNVEISITKFCIYTMSLLYRYIT